MELILTSFLSPILWAIPQGAVHNMMINLHPTDLTQARSKRATPFGRPILRFAWLALLRVFSPLKTAGLLCLKFFKSLILFFFLLLFSSFSPLFFSHLVGTPQAGGVRLSRLEAACTGRARARPGGGGLRLAPGAQRPECGGGGGAV